MSVAIDIEHVVKKFGQDTVIRDVSLNIRAGEFFTLLGPSGCGKTTLLRMIIGFNSIEEGEIRVGGKVINNIPTNQRNMGMVFQNYAIFPHLSVRENVAFGLQMRGQSKQQIDKAVDEILKVVKIDHLAERMPVKLSGGQQQRVALARAIVIEPQVLLMDEPLSNLDAKLRVEMRNAIKEIQHRIGITTVYVTHDQEEALAVSDRIAVMQGGIIQQVDTPVNIYRRPANRFVASFIGLSNPIKALLQRNGDTVVARFSDEYAVEFPHVRDDAPHDLAVIVSARPEEIHLHETGGGIPVTVESSVFLGLVTHYFVRLPDGSRAEIIQDRSRETIFENGSQLFARIDASKANIFRADDETSLIKGVLV
ncbi:MAG: ABC transporter ATP-binding protein [Cardiobacteriaceae bacterium]|nr:ABC transporter ATP-binding protein [Cardiobacteriaceae bacterium]